MSPDCLTVALAPGERVALVGTGEDRFLERLAARISGSCLLSGRFPRLDDECTGWDNLHRRLGHGYAARAASAFCGLDDFLDLRVGLYSTGMRWRLGFTLATAEPVDVLLAGRPMWSGDLAFRERVRHRLERLAVRARIAVLAGGDLGWLGRACTRAVWLEEGAVVRDGPACEVLEEYRGARLAAA